MDTLEIINLIVRISLVLIYLIPCINYLIFNNKYIDIVFGSLCIVPFILYIIAPIVFPILILGATAIIIIGEKGLKKEDETSLENAHMSREDINDYWRYDEEEEELPF